MGKTKVDAKIAVIGTGSEGCRIVNRFYWDVPEIDTIAIDDGVLSGVCSDMRIVLQSNTADSIKSFRENDVRHKVADLLHGYDIVYVITGLDGTMGSIISPLVANVASSSGCMVASIAIKPSTVGAGNSPFDRNVEVLRTECPMTVVINRDFVSKKIRAEDVQDAVDKSIVAYVRKHSDKLVNVFVRNLSKNVKDAFRTESTVSSSLFATAVSN